MLAVQESYRGRGIATKLVCMAIDAMAARDADEVRVKVYMLSGSMLTVLVDCLGNRGYKHSIPKAL